MPLNMTRAGERSGHLCSSQSPEILFLLTLPFIERGNRPCEVLELDFSGYPTLQKLVDKSLQIKKSSENKFLALATRRRHSQG
jgi:hypothetical protein